MGNQGQPMKGSKAMRTFRRFLFALAMSTLFLTSTHAQAVSATPEEVSAAASAANKSAQAAANSATAASIAASAAASAARNAWNPPSMWLLYVVPGIVLIGAFMAILTIR